MRGSIKAILASLVTLSLGSTADELAVDNSGVSVNQGAEIQMQAGTNFFGLGLLKKSTDDPCDTANRRDTELFWVCHSSVTEEVVTYNDVQIRLADGNFFLQRDLSDSADREYDELMMVVDALPKLVSFACVPGSPIEGVRLPVSPELETADIMYTGNIKKTLFADDSVAGWELDAFEVYSNLNSFCQDYFCEFAVVRTELKFWDCNEASLKETLWVNEQSIRVTLETGQFVFEQMLDDQMIQPSDLAIKTFGLQVSELIGDIVCHPSEKLVDIVLDMRTGLPESFVIEMTDKVVFDDNTNSLRLTINAYSTYTNKAVVAQCV